MAAGDVVVMMWSLSGEGKGRGEGRRGGAGGGGVVRGQRGFGEADGVGGGACGERLADIGEGGRRHGEAGGAESHEHDGEQGIGRGLAADAHRLAEAGAGLTDLAHQAEHRGVPRVLERGDRTEQAVGGHRVLREIVRADRREVGVREHTVGEQRAGGDLDHDTGRLQPVLASETGEVGGLLDRGDHRRHDPEVGGGRGVGLGEGGELLPEDVLARAERPEAAQSQGGVLLVGVVEEGQRLVGSRVEHAHDDLLARERLQEFAVCLSLLGHRGRLSRGEEQELGAEEPDALRPARDRVGGVCRLPEVREQRDRRAVGEGAGRERRVVGHPAGRRTFGGTGALLLRRLLRDDAGGGVDDHRVPGRQRVPPADADHGDDALLPGEDRRVGGGSAVGGDEGEHPVEVEQSRVGGSEVACHEHEGVSGIGHAGGVDPLQAGEHPLRDVVEVGGALAEVAAHGLEGGPEAGEGVVYRPFRGRAGIDPRVDLILQRGVLGDHRLRLQHLPCGAARGLAALRQFLRDDGDRFADPCALGLGARGARDVLRRGKRLGHADDGSLRDAETDPHSSELAHPAASWSWSVVNSSVSVSRTPSAPSPSAVRVT